MALPARIKVGPLTYRVSSKAASHDREQVEQKSELDGVCDHTKQQISLSPQLLPDASRVVLVHELLHAIFHITGLGHDMEDGTEEKLCRVLEGPLVMLLRDNPRLVAHLTER